MSAQKSSTESHHSGQQAGQELSDHFRYLDELRDSAVTNMWGAGAYLQSVFGLNKTDAARSHKLWMDTFDGKSTVAERVAKCIETVPEPFPSNAPGD